MAGSKRKQIKRIIYESASGKFSFLDRTGSSHILSELDNAEPASGSEYGQQLGEHKDNKDSEDEDIEDMELKDDAPDTTLQTKGKDKGKMKKGVEKQQEVQHLWNQYHHEVEKVPENYQSLKCKASASNPRYFPSILTDSLTDLNSS